MYSPKDKRGAFLLEDLIVEMRNISKRFPGVVALDGVDFSLRRGEIHALVGENGAGKSTLIKVLTGLYVKDSGTIKVNGKEVEILSPEDSLKLGIVAVYQELNFVPYFTVAESLFVGDEPLGRFNVIRWKVMYERSKQLLGDLGINVNPREVLKNLSPAEQQMIAIAKAVRRNAAVLIMDEPTAALSRKECDILFAFLKQLKAKSVSIVYISHRLDEIFGITDRVTVIRDGKNAGVLNTKDARLDQIVSMMIGTELRDKYYKERVQIGKEVLKVEGLGKSGVVDNINFVCHEGEILGIAGTVGSGRTEMARLLFGLERKDTGQIYIGGERVDIRSPKEAIRLGLALVPEERRSEGLALGMDVRQNMTLASLKRFCKLGVIDKKKEGKTARGFVDKLSIRTPGLLTKVRYLSGGNQQKVVLARWLSTDARILILDEPTRGIDVGAKLEMYKIIAELVKSGVSVILISVEAQEISALADRVLVMRRGHIVAELSGEDVNPKTIVSHAVGGA